MKHANGHPNGAQTNGHAPSVYSGGEGGLLSKSGHNGDDAAMVRRAMREGWPVSESVRRYVVAKLARAIRGAERPRDIAGLGRVLMTATGQNQNDRHFYTGLAAKAHGIDDMTIRIEYVDREPTPEIE